MPIGLMMYRLSSFYKNVKFKSINLEPKQITLGLTVAIQIQAHDVEGQRAVALQSLALNFIDNFKFLCAYNANAKGKNININNENEKLTNVNRVEIGIITFRGSI